MIRNTILVLSCGGFVALVACSSDASDKYPDVGSFCAAKADAECNQLAVGCGATVANCKSPRTSTCTTQGNSTGRAYRPSKAQTCIDKVNEVYAKKTISADDQKQVDDTCGRVFAGATLQGGGCKIDYDCASDLVCDKGICATKSQKNAGDFCGNPGEVCDDASFCDATNPPLKCNPRAAQGATCSDKVPCQKTLRCVIGAGTTMGQCLPLVNPGDPCSQDSDCPPTNSPPYCDPATKKCANEYQAGTTACRDFGGH